MAETRTLQIDQYGKLEFTVAVLVSGVAKPMVGWTAKMQIRAKKSSPTTMAEYTTEDGTISINGVQGLVLVDVPGSRTAQLTVTSAVYDLYVIDTDGVPFRVMEGNVLISLSTTRPVGA